MLQGNRVVLEERPLSGLGKLIQAMLKEARSRAGMPDGVVPSYIIIHFKRLTGATLDDPIGWGGRLLNEFDPPMPGGGRAYFKHYDDERNGSYGYFFFGCRAALLLSLSHKSCSVLTSLLQSGTLKPEGGGFTPEGFNTVLLRVSLWNADLDICESVDHIRESQQQIQKSAGNVVALANSSDRTTRGAIWLTYAIAVIGFTLSLLSFIVHSPFLAPGLVLIGLSCFGHARYAQVGDTRARAYGKGLFWFGLALIVAGVTASLVLQARGIKLPFG
jgi:hypothetical protein